MLSFTPERQKNAIAKLVEAKTGSLLEDLIVAAWAAYALTRDKPKSEPHQLAAGIINTFELDKFGWSTSAMIPGRLMFEGEDATFEDRLTQYSDLARKNEDSLRPNFIMMLGLVYLMTRDTPDDMLNRWAIGAMKRHRISQAAFTDKNPLRINYVPSNSDQVQ